MTEAKDYLNETFNLDFSLTYVSTLVESLGFEYCTHSPEFLEAPENKEKILIERIGEANITENDIVIGVDESTMKTGIRTKKGIYFKNSKKNEKK